MEGYVPYQKKVLSKLVEMYLYFPLYRYLYISGGLHDFLENTESLCESSIDSYCHRMSDAFNKMKSPSINSLSNTSSNIIFNNCGAENSKVGIVNCDYESITINNGLFVNLDKMYMTEYDGVFNMANSKVTINDSKVRDVDTMISSGRELEVNINNSDFKRINTMIHLYLKQENDNELEEALNKTPEYIKEEFYQEMAKTPKENWTDKIKSLKISKYLGAVEEVSDVVGRLLNLWDKVSSGVNGS